nr:cache domain-containing protein [bacterium]
SNKPAEEPESQAAPATENSGVTERTQLKSQTETALTELSIALKDKQIDQKDMYPVLKNFIEKNPGIIGSAFAFSPKEENGTQIKTCPYVYKSNGTIMEKDLINSYDYAAQKWFAEPVSLGQSKWSEPYFDDGGAGVNMITYSIPVYTADKKLIGVLTADLLNQ